eukprot:scaffold30076_cov76-Attheya_sp.AAC.1
MKKQQQHHHSLVLLLLLKFCSCRAHDRNKILNPNIEMSSSSHPTSPRATTNHGELNQFQNWIGD